MPYEHTLVKRLLKLSSHRRYPFEQIISIYGHDEASLGHKFRWLITPYQQTTGIQGPNCSNTHWAFFHD